LPKSYSEQEKDYIKSRLKEEAAKCLAQYGIRRTTVDEIVKRVKIPKGTFYLFYQSKELLLFDVILEQHDRIEQVLYKTIKGIDSSTYTTKQITDIIFNLYEMASESPILKMLNSDEIELLARKLPQDVIADHLKQDTSMIEKILTMLPVHPEVDVNTFGSAFRALYFATLHKDELDDENYTKALRLLIQGLVLQIF
jgi:AcrR family transcriptional regulator